MSIKLVSVAWSYLTVILKILHCNSIAVFFLYFYLSANVTSSNIYLDSYGHISVVYNILNHDITSRVWNIKTCAHVLLVLNFQRRSERWLSFVYTCVSLINQALVIRSFTILHRLAQLFHASRFRIRGLSQVNYCERK